MWRHTLRQVLEHKRVARVVSEASNGEEALELARRRRLDVVLMDIDLPKMDGVEATRRLLAEKPEIKVLVLSASDNRSQVINSIRAGASGYLLKTASSAEVADAVRRIDAGDLVFPPALMGVVLDEVRRGSPHEPGMADLSESESRVLALMAEGRSNQSIAQQLHLSPKTVEARVGRIFTKLGLELEPDDHRRVLAVIAYLRSV